MNAELEYYFELDDRVIIRVTNDAWDEYADEGILGELEIVKSCFQEAVPLRLEFDD